MKVPGILRNKYVLYVLLVVALVNVLGYLAIQDYNSLALFVVIGLLSTYFSKNMSVNLLIAIVVTSMVAINNKVQEGFTEGAGDDVQSKIKKTLSDINDTAKKAGEEASKKEEKPSAIDCKTDADCPEGKCDKDMWVGDFAKLLKSLGIEKPIWVTEAMVGKCKVLSIYINAFASGAELIIDVGVNAPGMKMSKKSRKKLNQFIKEIDGFKSVKLISKKKAEFEMSDGSIKTIDF